MDPCYRRERLENLGKALADFSLIEVTDAQRSAQRKAMPSKLYNHFETVLEGRVLRAVFAVVSDGVFASLSRRVLRSRVTLACRCSVSSSTICLTTRVVFSIAVSGLESYTLNRLFFVSFVNFQFPLWFKVGRTKRGLSHQDQVGDLVLGAP
ncbi:MAG: hypothetical protein ACJARR_002765 [Pseudophaeobacter arcticus]|jgi:hypothetical protein